MKLLCLPIPLDLSHTIFKRILLNFGWATAYNLLMIPFAMGLLAPFHLTLSPMISGMAMSMSSVSVVISSLMLKRYKRPAYESEYELNMSVESLQSPLVEDDGEGEGLLSSSTLQHPPFEMKEMRNGTTKMFSGITGNRKVDGYARLEDGL